MIDFIKKHPEIFTITGLLIFCYFMFIYGIGSYSLMDVDETRYVGMARDMFHSKDFMTLYLNGQFFFEKPPLFFWGECLSFKLFHVINEFSARFPVAMYGTLSTMLLYFTGRKVVSRKYGVVSALILATSVEFMILAKYAILDILLATCIEFSLCFGFLTYFVKDSNKKYCWWAFYIFSGLAVMAKGVPGIAVPFGTMLFVAIFTKRFKELFKPVYMIPGFILFCLVALPWHILMFKIHDPLFFNEYIIKHHLARFVDSSHELGRKQPFYFFMLTFLWGFCPWIFSAFTILFSKIKDIKKEMFKVSTETFTNTQKYLFFNFIAFTVTMLFFSSSSSKLVTYILPIYFAAAALMAWGWVQYIENNKYEKQIQIATYILFGVFLLASIVALFTKLFLPSDIYSDIVCVKWFTIILLFVASSLAIYFAHTNKRTALFATYIGFILILSAFGIPKYFNMDYGFGQNDLIQYGQYAKKNNLKIYTLNTGRRFSLNYYGPKAVTYGEDDWKITQQVLNRESDNTIFIIRNKNLVDIKPAKYKTIFTGKKYTLLSK